MPPKKPDLTYHAPVGSVDLAGEGWDIWPCSSCLPWHLEIIRDPETDFIYAREWHAVDCPEFIDLLAAAVDGAS